MKVDWQSLRLSEATPGGYADTAKPIEDLIKSAAERRAADKRPVVIWLCDAEDEKTNEQLESKVFTDEKVALAMKRFTCLRAEIQSIPDDREMEKVLKRAPVFIFYDPAGAEFDRLEGRRATSRSGFCSRIERLWDVSFEMRLKDYAKQMGKVLDQIDKVEGEKLRLTAKMERAVDDPTKLARLQKEEELLKSEQAKIEQEEKAILDALGLRPKFMANGEEQVRK